MKQKLLILLLIFSAIPTLCFSQSVIWEEGFDVNNGDWTLDPNWEYYMSALCLYWSPTIAPYDLCAVSPQITLPASVSDLIVTQWVNSFNAVDEVTEIFIIQDGVETLIWTWDLTQGDWGYENGEDIFFPISEYSNQTIQLKFRSHGTSTYNFDEWKIYNVAITGNIDHDLAVVSLNVPAYCTINSRFLWISPFQIMAFMQKTISLFI